MGNEIKLEGKDFLFAFSAPTHLLWWKKKSREFNAENEMEKNGAKDGEKNIAFYI